MSTFPSRRIIPARTRSSEPRVFDQIFRDHAAQVGRWVERLGGPTFDIDEAVQDVFLVVQRRLAECRGDAKLTTWLFRITTRTVANKRRSARRKSFLTRLTRRMEDQTPSGALSPCDALEVLEATKRFYRVLDDLADHYREVLVLFELEELSGEEIARLMDRPTATIRVWLRRARQQFAERWMRVAEREDA